MQPWSLHKQHLETLVVLFQVTASQIPSNQPPRFVSPIPTPTLGGGGSASITYSTTIAASPAKCLEILLDPNAYASWNKWVPRVIVTSTPPNSGSLLPPSLAHIATKNGQLSVGTEFYLEVHMDPSSEAFRKTELELTVLEEFERDGRKGIRVAWKTLGSSWLLMAERVQEFLENGDGGCEYTNYETFYGPLTWVVKRFVGGKLEAGLTLWKDGLKAEAEKSRGES